MSADRPDEFFFMEMNTRLQVEHPVTEAVLGSTWWSGSCGWRPASGCPGPVAGPEPQGHAIEARVYAEDPGRGFLPAAGTVLRLGEPTGPAPRPGRLRPCGRGRSSAPSYDPMLAKVIAWGEDRDRGPGPAARRPGDHRSARASRPTSASCAGSSPTPT